MDIDFLRNLYALDISDASSSSRFRFLFSFGLVINSELSDSSPDSALSIGEMVRALLFIEALLLLLFVSFLELLVVSLELCFGESLDNAKSLFEAIDVDVLSPFSL